MSSKTAELVLKAKDEMSGPVNNASGNVDGFNKNIAIGTAAVIAFTAAVAAQITQLANYGAGIYDTSTRIRISTDDVQAWDYALQQVGGNFTKVEAGMMKLNRVVEEAAAGNPKYLETIEKIGLSLEQLQEIDPTDRLILVGNTLNGIEDAGLASAAAMELLGGGAARSIAALAAQTNGDIGSMLDTFDELGFALSQEQVAALKAYDDQMTDLSFQMKGLKADILEPLIPVFKQFIDGFEEFNSEHGPEVEQVTDGIIRVLGVLFGVLIDLDTIIRDVNESLGTFGDVAGWVVNPAGNLLGVLGEFVSTAADAEQATDDMNEAMERAAVTQEAATIIAELYSDAMAGDAEQVSYLIGRLEQLESQGANVGGILDNLRARHEELTHEQEIAGLQIGAITAKTQDLTLAEIDAERKTIDLAIAVLKMQETMADGPTVIRGQIAELESYRDSLDDLFASIKTTHDEARGMNTSLSSGPDAEKVEQLAKALPGEKDLELIGELGMAMREVWENAKAGRIDYEEAQMQGIDMINERELQALRDRQAEEMEDLNERAEMKLALHNMELEWQGQLQGYASQLMGIMSSFQNEIADMFVTGEMNMESWGQNAIRIFARVAASAAINTILRAISFAGKGGFGGFLGALFNAGGNVVPRKAAAGSYMTPDVGMIGDVIPAFLGRGEMVISEASVQQARNNEADPFLGSRRNSGSGGSSRTEVFIHRPVYSTSSKGDIARARRGMRQDVAIPEGWTNE